MTFFTSLYGIWPGAEGMPPTMANVRSEPVNSPVARESTPQRPMAIVSIGLLL